MKDAISGLRLPMHRCRSDTFRIGNFAVTLKILPWRWYQNAIPVSMALSLFLGSYTQITAAASCSKHVNDIELQYYCADSRLPDWLENNRVHGQVGLYNFTRSNMLDQELEEIQKLGLNVYTRHTKLDWRPPIWPSLVPTTEGGAQVLELVPDDLAALIEKASRKNIKLIAYYYEAAEGIPTDLSRKLLVGSRERYNWNPPNDWHCKALDGSHIPVEQRKNSPFRGYHLDLNSGYREFLLQRLIEAVDRGASALYFDERHFPKAQVSPCYGSTTEKNFLKSGGTSLKYDTSGAREPEFIRYQAKAMAEAFDILRKGVALAHPDRNIPFIISGSYLSSYVMPHMSLELANTADVVKVEYLNGSRNGLNGNLYKNKKLRIPPDDIRLALGWVIPRDSGNGKPIHMWHHRFDSLDEIYSYAATSQAYGAITGIYIPPKYLLGDRERQETLIGLNTEYKTLAKGIAYSQEISGPLAYTRPHSEFGIYLSESQKNKLNTGEQVWKEQLAYVNALFEIFVRHGLPVRIITDKDLSDPDSMRRFKHIFTADNALDDTASALIEKNYDLSQVYINDEPQAFALKRSFKKAMQILKRDVIGVTQNLYSAKSQFGGSTPFHEVHTVFHRSLLSGNLVVALVQKPKIQRKDVQPSPPNISGYELILRKKPKSVLLSHSGLKLEITEHKQQYKIKIPTFTKMTLIDVEY